MYSAINFSNQKGQALLIILLVMAVILTIALSVISRSVTDISVSQKEEEGARAYSAAEAGIERILLSGDARLGENLPSGDQFTTEITGLASGSEYVVPLLMSSGETTSVWLVAHNDDKEIECSTEFPCFTGNEIKLCWGEEGTLADIATTPAIEMSIIYTLTSELSSARIGRTAIDPNSTRNNNFAKVNEGECTVENKKFAFSKRIELDDFNPDVNDRDSVSDIVGPQTARIRLLYNTDRAHSVGMVVIGEGSFPQQGSKIASQGTSGQSTRKIEVFQLYPDLPPVFDYGIFSGTGGITK